MGETRVRLLNSSQVSQEANLRPQTAETSPEAYKENPVKEALAGPSLADISKDFSYRQAGQADLSSLQVLPRHPVCSRVCVPGTDEPGKVLGSDKDGQRDDCYNCCPVSSHNNLGKILDEGEQPVGGELQEAHEVQEQRGRREPIFQDGSPY